MIELLIIFAFAILFISQYETARMPIDESAQRIRTSMADKHRANISQLEKSLVDATAKIAQLEAAVKNTPSQDAVELDLKIKSANFDASSIKRSIEDAKFTIGVVNNWSDADVKCAYSRGAIY